MIPSKKKSTPSKKIEDPDGLVWIINGKIFVKNEKKGGLPAHIQPCDGSILKINGIECNYLTMVSEKDEFELTALSKELPVVLNPIISDDKLEASLEYSPRAKIKQVIRDVEPANKIDVVLEEILKENMPISKDEILHKLKSNNIIYGIIDENIDEIVNKNSSEIYTVARGLEPQKPIDEEIEYYFDNESDKEINLPQNSMERIDYKNIINYISVNSGDIIAKLHKAELGKVGYDVFGDEILPKKPKSISISPSNSIEIDEKTGIIRSKKYGRPITSINKNTIIIQLLDKLLLEEVGIASGNVKFKGDVEVKGNVLESMEVIAKHDILISGNVNFSNIYSGNNITVKGGIISSKLNSGVKNIFGENPSVEIIKIIKQAELLQNNLINLPKSIIEQKKLESVADKIRYLISTENTLLTSTSYSVISQLRKDNYDIDPDVFAILINKVKPLLGNFHEITNFNKLTELIDTLKALCNSNEEDTSTCNISTNYILNSELNATGTISVTGKGCFNSKIFAKGKIIVSGTIRGGEITSEGNIDVNIAGSENGVKSFINTSENGIIQIKTAHPDTVIRIGHRTYKFLATQSMVRAKLVENSIVLK